MGLVTERAAATIGSFPGGVQGAWARRADRVRGHGSFRGNAGRDRRSHRAGAAHVAVAAAGDRRGDCDVFGRTHGIIGCPSRGKQKGT